MNKKQHIKSERHYALDDFCCNGDCSQGRQCPRQPRVEAPSHFTLGDLLMATTLVGACLGLVFMGPMVQGWIA